MTLVIAIVVQFLEAFKNRRANFNLSQNPVE